MSSITVLEEQPCNIEKKKTVPNILYNLFINPFTFNFLIRSAIAYYEKKVKKIKEIKKPQKRLNIKLNIIIHN